VLGTLNADRVVVNSVDGNIADDATLSSAGAFLWLGSGQGFIQD
jgi:hypothetical protein